MYRVSKIINNTSWRYKENDEVILDSQDRYRRRISTNGKRC